MTDVWTDDLPLAPACWLLLLLQAPASRMWAPASAWPGSTSCLTAGTSQPSPCSPATRASSGSRSSPCAGAHRTQSTARLGLCPSLELSSPASRSTPTTTAEAWAMQGRRLTCRTGSVNKGQQGHKRGEGGQSPQPYRDPDQCPCSCADCWWQVGFKPKCGARV